MTSTAQVLAPHRLAHEPTTHAHARYAAKPVCITWVESVGTPAAHRAGHHPGAPPSFTDPEPPTHDTDFMQRCLALARRALAAGDVPVGAIVVRDGTIVGEGHEQTRARLDPAAHAEVEALRDACHRLGAIALDGATLYTTVEPCVLCAYAARATHIARVVYGTPAGTLGGATGPYPILTHAADIAGHAPPAVQGGVLAAECERLLRSR